MNTQCGSGHFWMVNWPNSNTPIATVSLRRKEGASNAGISTYGKCGAFSFKIKRIRVLNWVRSCGFKCKRSINNKHFYILMYMVVYTVQSCFNVTRYSLPKMTGYIQDFCCSLKIYSLLSNLVSSKCSPFLVIEHEVRVRARVRYGLNVGGIFCAVCPCYRW